MHENLLPQFQQMGDKRELITIWKLYKNMISLYKIV
jgi:hypothetical protein